MSRPKKDIVKLSEQGVVTEEALIAYAQNKLSAEEKQELEKLLEQDPFARDALEGLQSSANQTTVTSSISSLKKKVRERSGLKEGKGLHIHWVNYAWAAVVLGLLIGIGFIMVNFLNKKDNNLALNQKNESANTPVVQLKDTTSVYEKAVVAADSTTWRGAALTDSVAVPVSAAIPQTKQGGLKQTITTGAATNSVVSPSSVNAANGKASQTYAMQPVTAPTGLKPKPIDAEQTKNSFLRSKAAADSVRVSGYYGADKNSSQATTAASRKESSPPATDQAVLQDEAMKSFNSADYAKAGDYFDQILKHDPDNPDALYFGGISDYINGKTAKSENNFDKLLKKGSKYIDGSKWYKANILIKKGHSDAAKPLLQDLSTSNGSYKERAVKKLAEMGF